MERRDLQPGVDFDRSSSNQQLFVEFEVEPASTCPCPLADFDGTVGEVRRQLVGGKCHADTVLHDGDRDPRRGGTDTEVVHTATRVEATCPCSVFGELGCVAEMTAIRGGRVRYETYLSDRKRLTELVEALREVTDALHLNRLKRIEAIDDDGRPEAVTLDLPALTEKQREAALRAVASGYYATPRETSLEELAAALDISKSALSQRLSAVESKLATAAFDGSSRGG